MSGCLSYRGKTIQTDQSNANYTKVSPSTVNLIGQLVLCFLQWDKQPKIDCISCSVNKVNMVFWLFEEAQYRQCWLTRKILRKWCFFSTEAACCAKEIPLLFSCICVFLWCFIVLWVVCVCLCVAVAERWANHTGGKRHELKVGCSTFRLHVGCQHEGLGQTVGGGGGRRGAAGRAMKLVTVMWLSCDWRSILLLAKPQHWIAHQYRHHPVMHCATASCCCQYLRVACIGCCSQCTWKGWCVCAGQRWPYSNHSVAPVANKVHL